MTGFDSKRQMAQAKVQEEMQAFYTERQAAKAKVNDDEAQGYIAEYEEALLIVYQSGFADGKRAAKRPWVGLTDDEIDSCWYQSGGVTPGFARTVEAKLRSKNDH